jgi:Asp-tRNA(Asn)/Glu-tRNA(Gln) amidotransferase A subunit family amidase
MTDTPWLGDACSLVDAFRAGERTPAEELELVLGAIERSALNAVPFVDQDGARAAAAAADPAQPFGGVPAGVKELDNVEGWPATEASLVFRDRVASYTSTMVQRLRGDGGAVLVGQTTASEFGGLNVSTTRLHGTTHNPWQQGRTAGGSSGGSAAAVAGGLLPLATGGDGGGSIRIPAAFNGLVGMKGTAGRIPRGPRTMISPLTVVVGCLSRSVRDVARYTTCAPAMTRATPTASRRWRAGSATWAATTCGAGGSRSRRRWAAPSCDRRWRRRCATARKRWCATPASWWWTSTCACPASASSGP